MRKNNLIASFTLLISMALLTSCKPAVEVETLDCKNLKESFDDAVERQYLPVIEDSNSLCHGLNVSSDFSALEPKWAVGELIEIVDYGLIFKGLSKTSTIPTALGGGDRYEYKVGNNYKMDMNNICRNLFATADSRFPSPILESFVPMEKVNCMEE